MFDDKFHEIFESVILEVRQVGVHLCDLTSSLLKNLANLVFSLNLESPCLHLQNLPDSHESGIKVPT